MEDTWDHADIEEVRRECRAQIERAILWGFDISHLDSHMGTLQLRPEFFDVYLELAVDFGLPLRMGSSGGERLVGFPYRDLAAAEGVVFPDHSCSRRWAAATRSSGAFELRPGVTGGVPCTRRRQRRATRFPSRRPGRIEDRVRVPRPLAPDPSTRDHLSATAQSCRPNADE
jgi:hypothetical protein